MQREWRTRRVVRGERSLLWLVEYLGDRPVRRLLVDDVTGEVVDDVWLDRKNRVRSYSAPPPGHRPARPGRQAAVERGNVPASGAAANAAPAAGTIVEQQLALDLPGVHQHQRAPAPSPRDGGRRAARAKRAPGSAAAIRRRT